MNRQQRRAAKHSGPLGGEQDSFLAAVALHRAGKLPEAIRAYGRVDATHPQYPEAQCYRGAALFDLGKAMEALSAYDKALEARPDYADAHYNAGLALKALDRLEEAAERYRRAITLRPDHAKALSNLANVVRMQGDFALSADLCRQAIALAPEFANAHANLGNALLDMGRPDEAALSYGRATRLDPSLTESHWGEAFALLAAGKYQEGWRKHEWRWKKADMPPHPHKQPQWQGQDISGQTILLHCEQGLGDSLQFIRYAALVKAKGAHVVVLAPKRLARLLSTAPGIDRVITDIKELGPCQWQCPLMSLPLAFGTTLETVPAPIPYLSADPERMHQWRERLGEDGFKIGLVWQGNPKAAMDRGRSAPLSAFRPLGDIPGVRLISLQHQHGLDQLALNAGVMKIETLGDDFDSGPDAFMDAAAVMMGLDLILSTDTAIAHLAGSLGRPVGVLLQANPDWRWLLGRNDTPWYPTMRLFRQTKGGDWDGVVRQIVDYSGLIRPVIKSSNSTGEVS